MTNHFVLKGNSKPVIKITADGRVELGEGCTNQEAAQLLVDYANKLMAEQRALGGQPVAIPFDTVQRVVKALTQHGVAVPESQEEQSARAIRLIHELCRCAPAQGIDMGQFHELLGAARMLRVISMLKDREDMPHWPDGWDWERIDSAIEKAQGFTMTDGRDAGVGVDRG